MEIPKKYTHTHYILTLKHMIMHMSEHTVFRDVHKDGVVGKGTQKDIYATSKIAVFDGVSLNSSDKDRWKCYKERWAL